MDNIDELFPENKVKFCEIDDANTFIENLNASKPFGAFIKIIKEIRGIEKLVSKIINLKDRTG